MEVDHDFGFQPSSKINPESNDDDYAGTPEKLPQVGKSSGKRSKATVDEEELGVWGNLDKPFVGFKMASMTLRKILKHTPEQLTNLELNAEMKEEDQKPKWVQGEQEQD